MQYTFGTSWIVPWETMTLTEIKAYKEAALLAGVKRALDLKIVTDESQLTAVPPRAFADIGIGTVAEDEWAFNLAVAGLNAAIINVAIPANQVWVWYAIDDWDPAPQATLVTFRTALVGGTTKMQVDLQDCRGFTFCAGMLSEPIVYDRSEQMVVDIQSDAIHVPEYIKFMGYVILPRGARLS
jgi:hypothetical protein